MDVTWGELSKSLQSGFIDQAIASNHKYLPQLLVNDPKRGLEVLGTIDSQLHQCDEFWFSVAFVTTGGIATMLHTLQDLALKGTRGRVLVSQYLNFSQPEALRRLLRFNNIELKISTRGNLHSKGYLFKKDKIYDLIIGSSNLTAGALRCNKEWNLKVTAASESYIIFNALKEFDAEFDAATTVDESYIATYNDIYLKQKALLRNNQRQLVESIQYSPNEMQRDALANLAELRGQGKSKALLISATGTGKTFLSAFDVLHFNPKKFLFVVHRANIAEAAMRTFKCVFGESKSMGYYSGERKQIDADFLFATIQTISRDEHLKAFESDYFDYIVIDESHRAGAESYKKIVDHFCPKFILGMTATPERTDGKDIFKLFDHCIAYEIRLHKAMELEMLSPFHYYGVSDISVNGKPLEENADFNKLISSERIDRILEKSKFYGCDNGNIRGLIFCSRVDECKEMSKAFNSRGYKTLALDKDSSDVARALAIEQLESNDAKTKLDYIFTVDIFNEGVDIPKVNQIIMLRPTQSAIIFVQQLGRGLRKADDKEYLCVIDFIGNYKNNFLVPIALYGDTSFNKDNLRKLISSGNSYLPGESTVNFDRVAKERIFAAIDTARLEEKKDLRRDYQFLKSKLGRIPKMLDFVEHGERDPIHYVKCSKSYFNFVSEEETHLSNLLSKEQKMILELFSREICNGKRIEDVSLMQILLTNGEVTDISFGSILAEKYKINLDEETVQSCINNLNFDFVKKHVRIVERSGNDNRLDSEFSKLLENQVFKDFLLDALNYAKASFEKRLATSSLIGGFVLHQKYSRKDVFRILNYETNPNPQNVGGYFARADKTKFPIFVTYKKKEHISESIKYADEFIDQTVFSWETKGKRYIDSPEVKLLQANPSNLRILLFIQKSNDEGIEFYYMGDVKPIQDSFEEVKKPKGVGDVVKIDFVLDNPVDDSLYKYITESKAIVEEEVKEDHLSNYPVSSQIRMLIPGTFDPFVNCIPVYNIKIAAGVFTRSDSYEIAGWVELPDRNKDPYEYFVCQVMGHSMNKIIPSGSWCLFKRYLGGSRNGKTVLVRHSKIQDADYGTGFTIKQYKSEKLSTGESWRHNKIVLSPKSNDPAYRDIILEMDDMSEFAVVGEFVSILY